MAETGEFRLNLFFRLKIMHLTSPPLLERRDDAALLAAHFLQECAARFNRGTKTLDADTITWFDKYSWPGNIRELENLIYREYLLADEPVINIGPLVIREGLGMGRTDRVVTKANLWVKLEAVTKHSRWCC